MAKTTSQIIAENQAKRAEAEAIAASRDAIHQQQMEALGTAPAERTQAVLNGTSNKLVNTEQITLLDSFVEIIDDPIPCAIIGGLLGSIVTMLYFKIKIKRMKNECETRVNEARDALDRMLKIAAKE